MLTCVVHVSTLHSTCQHYIRQRVKLDHFDYFKGKIVLVVSLGCSVAQDDYLKGKIESLPFVFQCKLVYSSNHIITIKADMSTYLAPPCPYETIGTIYLKKMKLQGPKPLL